eukprot:COSAG02_NODE_56466_length_285_cov_1.064516_1_plen_68_part_10
MIVPLGRTLGKYWEARGELELGGGWWWSGMGVGQPVASVVPRAAAARSPLCTLTHTNSREDAEAVRST